MDSSSYIMCSHKGCTITNDVKAFTLFGCYLPLCPNHHLILFMDIMDAFMRLQRESVGGFVDASDMMELAQGMAFTILKEDTDA